MSTAAGSKNLFHRDWLIAGFLVLTLAKLAATLWVGGSGDVRHPHAEAVVYLAGRNVFEPENTGKNPGYFPGVHYGLAAGILGLPIWLVCLVAFSRQLRRPLPTRREVQMN